MRSIFTLIFIGFSPFILFVPCTAQQLYNGRIEKLVFPALTPKKLDSLTISYHNSFSGSIKLFVDDDLIYESAVAKVSDPSILGKIIIKRRESSIPQILTIILNDKFYVREVLEFWHPYVRIFYSLENKILTIGYGHVPPINE